MAFNEALDVIHDSKEAYVSEKTHILVQVVSYNSSSKKLQIKRENKSHGEWTFAKLGRLEPQEFIDLVPVAFELLEKHGLGGN